MKMVGHEAVSYNPYGRPLFRLAEQRDKGGEVAVFMKDGAAGIAAVEDVIAKAALASTCGAWHGANYGRKRGIGKRKVRCPLCFLKYDVPFEGACPIGGRTGGGCGVGV